MLEDLLNINKLFDKNYFQFNLVKIMQVKLIKEILKGIMKLESNKIWI